MQVRNIRLRPLPPMFIMYLLLVTSCKGRTEKGVEVRIENNSSSIVHDLEISTSERYVKLKKRSLHPAEVVEAFLPMEKNKRDGDYLVGLTRHGAKKEIHMAGYYTNGSPFERTMKVDIQNDTVLITFDGRRY